MWFNEFTAERVFIESRDHLLCHVKVKSASDFGIYFNSNTLV
jgi:hypothetical protein